LVGRAREAARAHGLPPRDAPARHGVHRDQGRRVPRQVGARSRAGAVLPLGARRRPAGADLLLAVLRDDGLPRAPHADRLRPPPLAPERRPSRPVRSRVLRARRGRRALLALRRHRLDLPLPAPLPDRSSLVGHQGPTRTIYVTIFVALLCLTGATVGAAEL